MPSNKSRGSRNSKYLGERSERAILTEIQESSENTRPSSNTVHQQQVVKQIEIDDPNKVRSVAFLADGKHIVSGGWEGKIRRWRVEDGGEVGTPMDAGGNVLDIAVSQDGQWVVSGTESGRVTMWNEGYRKVTAFTAHSDRVWAVDVSPDGTTIATGSNDKTVRLWSLSTDYQLRSLLQHDYVVVGVKFSPDGRLIATVTATRRFNSVRIYDSQRGCILVAVPIQVSSPFNRSLAWTSDSKQLFVLSHGSNINCLDVSTGTTRSRWPIHNSSWSSCIALASNGTFIAASVISSVSFWDTMTHQQIGSVIEHTTGVESMAISANHDLAMAGDGKITLCSLRDILPSFYFCSVFAEPARQPTEVKKIDVKEKIESLPVRFMNRNNEIARLKETVQRLSDNRRILTEGVRSLSSEIARLTETVQQLRNQPSDNQHIVNNLNESMKFLQSKVALFEETAQQLCELSDNPHTNSLNESIKFLHSKVVCLGEVFQQFCNQS